MTASTFYRQKRDPDKNMHRLYALSVQPNLFGEWSLIRAWGRIGKAGRMKIARHETHEAAHGGYRKRNRKKGDEGIGKRR